MVNCMEGGLPETIEELDFTRMRKVGFAEGLMPVSYTHLTLPTNTVTCRSRWSPYH